MAEISYTKTNWVNNVTKLNADNMNHIEDGIKNASDAINSVKLYAHHIKFDEGSYKYYIYAVSSYANPATSIGSITDLFGVWDPSRRGIVWRYGIDGGSVSKYHIDETTNGDGEYETYMYIDNGPIAVYESGVFNFVDDVTQIL